MKKLIMGLLVGIFLLVGCAGIALAKNPQVLRWALIPTEEAAAELELWKPVGQYLEAELGIPVQVIVCSDYTAVVQALKFGHAEMARLGPFSYVLATTQIGVEAIVRAVWKNTGRDHYFSLIITHRYSDIQSIRDLKGKTFAFTDPASTSGYLVPKTILIKEGIDPDTDLSEAFYTQSHGAVALAIKKNKVDAGAIADHRLLDAIKKGAIKESEVVVIYRSEPIPSAPVAVRKDLSEDLKSRIQKALLEMPEELAERADTKILRWVKTEDQDYDPVREVAQILELDLTKK